ncbi:uncharacterized protein LOC110834541 isoform X1 [Zootermopsis nevadensis]|uniref:uncharacterized protein LOC110834541 isoform X1 n=2 Tax=Zootermopsis nevadensis TaxID=136037 RepID=UPI000B8E3479|nr:uncharacterized protein LOC110834541 isoform X1 [Zootermopsis nevadensis]
MGICTRRHFLLTICILQVVSTVERQVFDFLGYMWAPILANFFHIIFVIFGFFGTFQYRPKYIIAYTVWGILWTGWNVFVICFYLSIGILDKDSDILNLGTGSVSWWEVNGAGCKPSYPTNLTSELDPDPSRPLRPEHVTGCFLDYQYVEVLHAALQCLLAVLGSMSGISVSHVFLEEDDSSRANKFGTKRNGAGGARTSLYSIEFSPHHDAGRGLGDDSVEFEDDIGTHVHAPQLSPRPMTPRRVKRRSVISRGSTGRSSLPNCHDKRSSVRYSNNVRSSLRTSGRRSKLQHQNPVTRLIEQQQQSLADSSTSNDSTRLNLFDPSSSSQADLLSNASTPHWKKASGHTNPLYQQSSMQSLDDDDVYNNRPSSARSSYSNYHGTRPISCYVGPGGTPAYYMAGQATAQVPVTNTHRRSNHAIAKTRPTSGFLNSGPPAYQVQGVVDSETVI